MAMRRSKSRTHRSLSQEQQRTFVGRSCAAFVLGVKARTGGSNCRARSYQLRAYLNAHHTAMMIKRDPGPERAALLGPLWLETITIDCLPRTRGPPS